MIAGAPRRLWTPAALLKDPRRLFGGPPRRRLNVSGRLAGKAVHRPEPRERVHVPGLETVSYGDRMHWVPGLDKPVFARWEPGHRDPRFYRSPAHRHMPLYREKACHVFHQRTSVLEEVRQALWLTKTKLTAGLPPQLLSLAESSANQIGDQDERVQNIINHAHFWELAGVEAEPKEDYW
ncbi:hypothetical protein CRUP_030592 [Coryphaenoides rupestris]|nr:hypothetical protein CRUP_030592 [Coryphaenoides rupestris]